MTALVRTLTVTRGTGLMLNIVIGAGLLALPGLVVKEAGDHAIWAWLVCSLASIPLLAVFMIMGRKYPNAGGVAHFARMAFGSKLYAIASLLFLGAVIFGLPSIALTGGHYIASMLPGPPALYAAGLLVAAAAIQLLSPSVAGRISTIVSSCIIAALVLVAAFGAFAVDWGNISTHVARPDVATLPLIFAPFMMIFFAFTGWEVAASLSEEFKNPGRDFPKAMLLSFGIATLFYLVMAFIAQTSPVTGNHEATFVGILAARFGSAAGAAMTAVATLIIFGNLTGAIWAVSRLVYSTSREGLIPLRFVPDAKGVPLAAVAVTLIVFLTVVMLVATQVLSLDGMMKLAGQNFLILYGIVAVSLAKLAGSVAVRLLAGVTAFLVGILLYSQGLTLAYPAAIAFLAIILNARVKVVSQPAAVEACPMS
jgi:amino acid efflux transporter